MLTRLLHAIRAQAVLVVVIVLGIFAGGAITLLELHADASRQAEAKIGALKFALSDLQGAPFNADPRSGGSPGYAAAKIKDDRDFISENVQSLIAAGAAPAPVLQVEPAVRDLGPTIEQIFDIGAYRGGYGGPQRLVLNRVQRDLQERVASTLGLLSQADGIYNHRAATAKMEAIFGSLATAALLLSIFALFYQRAALARRRATLAWAAAERLSAENARLLDASRDEAITDPLTSLGNRRAFTRHVEEILPGVTADHELMVGMFDLDGFKQYNDTFGHGAGDALLSRLAKRLKETAAGSATAYRMGGDEFCLLAQIGSVEGERLMHSAVAALTETGEGWQVGSSWGLSWIPSDAIGTSEALRLADERMYAQKASRVTAGYQATAALVQVLVECDLDLSTHISRVAALSTATAERLGVPEHEVTRIGLAAQLHDIGKTAIPESILAKPGSLDSDEWALMRRHTVIGQRIISAAPSLAHTASIVRSSHERMDGTGYPDGLTGADIPLGSRIIAVCDSYDAMVAERAYRKPENAADAIRELHDCAGSQFDPDVVAAFEAVVSESDRPLLAAATTTGAA